MQGHHSSLGGCPSSFGRLFWELQKGCSGTDWRTGGCTKAHLHQEKSTCLFLMALRDTLAGNHSLRDVRPALGYMQDR